MSNQEPIITGINHLEISLEDFMKAIFDKLKDSPDFLKKDPKDIMLEISWEQFQHFGYDLYDASDYQIVIRATVK